MQKNYLLTLFMLAFFVLNTSAQDFPREEVDLDKFILNLFPIQDEDLDYEDIYETLFQYYRTPLDLNRATRDELQSIFILSELQINSFLAYREKYGSLLSIYELQSIPNFDLGTIYNFVPFAKVAPNPDRPQSLFKRILEEENNYLLLRYDRTLERQKGFQDDATSGQRYLGTSGRMYARFRVSHVRDFSLGFTLEKDNGEQLIWDTRTRRYGMDFISFHAYFENKGRFEKIALGDYQLQIGQGLLLAGGFGIGKGAESVQGIRRSNVGIRSFTSALETGFFRGVAAAYRLSNQLSLTGFYSRVRRDGTFRAFTDTTEAEQEAFIETLRTSGLHRTETEVAGKGLFVERTMGANLLFNNRQKTLQIGLTGIYTTYNIPFQRNQSSQRDSLLYLFEFRGKENYNLGTNISYNWQNFTFFGEAARSRSGGVGFVGGVLGSLSPQVEFAYHVRHYDKDFHTFFGSALGESTRNINENGMYWGIKITPIVRKLVLSGYYDYFRFPWLRFRVDAPSEGYEWLARATYSFSRSTRVFLQFRQEVKDRNLSSDESTDVFRQISTGNKRNYLINMDYNAPKIFRIQTRVQFSTFDFNGKRTSGFAIAQDLGADLGKLKLNGRVALFDTEDFDNRQYIFEKDVLWAFSIPAYSGQGMRSYLLARYQISRKLDVWIRYARFDFRDREVISSGGEEIQGSTRSEIKMQVRVRF